MTIQANPKPTLLWRVNGISISEGSGDSEGRMEALTAIPLVCYFQSSFIVIYELFNICLLLGKRFIQCNSENKFSGKRRY